jgi:hypothetical protein
VAWSLMEPDEVTLLWLCATKRALVSAIRRSRSRGQNNPLAGLRPEPFF